jgi:hypothetical protein
VQDSDVHAASAGNFELSTMIRAPEISAIVAYS